MCVAHVPTPLYANARLRANNSLERNYGAAGRSTTQAISEPHRPHLHTLCRVSIAGGRERLVAKRTPRVTNIFYYFAGLALVSLGALAHVEETRHQWPQDGGK